MFTFKNSNGATITTSDPSAANDYRTREGFTEVKPKSETSNHATPSK